MGIKDSLKKNKNERKEAKLKAKEDQLKKEEQDQQDGKDQQAKNQQDNADTNDTSIDTMLDNVDAANKARVEGTNDGTTSDLMNVSSDLMERQRELQKEIDANTAKILSMDIADLVDDDGLLKCVVLSGSINDERSGETVSAKSSFNMLPINQRIVYVKPSMVTNNPTMIQLYEVAISSIQVEA